MAALETPTGPALALASPAVRHHRQRRRGRCRSSGGWRSGAGSSSSTARAGCPTRARSSSARGALPVYAPEWPGYRRVRARRCSRTCSTSRCMGWDVVDALGLQRAAPGRPLDGRHDRGRDGLPGPPRPRQLVLVAPAGLWLDEHPIPDIFAVLPFELAELLFADPAMRVASSSPAGCDLPPTRRSTRSWSRTRAGWARPARSCSRSPTAGCRSGCTACRLPPWWCWGRPTP